MSPGQSQCWTDGHRSYQGPCCDLQMAPEHHFNSKSHAYTRFLWRIRKRSCNEPPGSSRQGTCKPWPDHPRDWGTAASRGPRAKAMTGNAPQSPLIVDISTPKPLGERPAGPGAPWPGILTPPRTLAQLRAKLLPRSLVEELGGSSSTGPTGRCVGPLQV